MSGRAGQPLAPELRPRLRGVSHAGAAVVALGAGIALCVAARGGRDIIACAIYAVCLTALFTVSAIYHRVIWPTPEARERMRQLDHSTIFLMVAGSYTPIALIAVRGTTGTVIMLVVWIGAAIGITVRILFSDAPRWVTTGPYIALGWVALFAIPAIIHHLGWVALGLIAGGGALYTIGAVVYARRRPDPWPRVFGYHEIFHALVVVAAALQYAVIAFWVL